MGRSSNASTARGRCSQASRSFLSRPVGRRPLTSRALGRDRLSSRTSRQEDSAERENSRHRRHLRCYHPREGLQQPEVSRLRNRVDREGKGNPVRPRAGGSFPQPTGSGANRESDEERALAAPVRSEKTKSFQEAESAGHQLSMAETISRAARAGSVDPNTEAITATPAAPASITSLAFREVIPPIPTAGNPVAAERRENCSIPIGNPASLFDFVPNTGPMPT